jgi:serine/threonine protein phosphatase PrpC
VVPRRREPSPPRRPHRESSASRERRKQERKEQRKRDRHAERERAQRNETREGEADYRQSLYPPGSDLSLYTYDPAVYWHVTADKVWWFRPDLVLWYDCRSESYYTYDVSIAEYISVDREKATHALTHGLSVAPQAVGAAAEEEAPPVAPAAPAAPDGADDEGYGVSIGPALPDAGPAPPEAAADEADGSDEGGEEESAPVDAEEEVARALAVHTESWQGKKEAQEDRYIQGTRLGKLGTAFGVFDGHGGVHAAEYVAKHLPNNVMRCHVQRSSSSSSRRESFGAYDEKRMTGAMEDAFPLTDRELMSIARRRSFTDGTTALMAVLCGSELDKLSLLCAHVGDCRAVLCRGGAAVRLTNDHRPDRKDEQQRIRAAGGGVFQVAGIWRCTSAAGAARALDSRAGFIDNESHTYLSCSRTLGDPELKLNPERPILSNVPDTSATKLTPDDLFFVIACDGVWDVLSDQQVVDLVLDHWPDPAAAAAKIVRTALSSGSGDNLTAQVVLFSWKQDAGLAAAKKRAEELKQEALRKPAPKPVVEEGEVDMFG